MYILSSMSAPAGIGGSRRRSSECRRPFRPPAPIERDTMRLHTILFAAAALLPLAAHAEDYAGGAIKTAEGGGHEILTGANGMTLYTYDKDVDGTSTCYG